MIQLPGFLINIKNMTNITMKKLFQSLTDFFKNLFTKKVVEEAEIISDNQDIINDVDTSVEPEIIEEQIKESEPIKEPKPIKEEEEPIKLSSKNPKYDKLYVFLTPGHTKYTPGKYSPDKSLYEWKYNRIIVGMIEKELDNLGIRHWNSHPEEGWVDSRHTTDSKDLVLRA